MRGWFPGEAVLSLILFLVLGSNRCPPGECLCSGGQGQGTGELRYFGGPLVRNFRGLQSVGGRRSACRRPVRRAAILLQLNGSEGGALQLPKLRSRIGSQSTTFNMAERGVGNREQERRPRTADFAELAPAKRTEQDRPAAWLPSASPTPWPLAR